MAMQRVISLLTGYSPDERTIRRAPKNRALRKTTKRQLIQLESNIGRTIFGAVPAGHTREFFNLDPTTWIWHEEYTAADGTPQAITTRYEVKENGILKAQDGMPYSYLEGQELYNFSQSIRAYYSRVARELYHCEV